MAPTEFPAGPAGASRGWRHAKVCGQDAQDRAGQGIPGLPGQALLAVDQEERYAPVVGPVPGAPLDRGLGVLWVRGPRFEGAVDQGDRLGGATPWTALADPLRP